MINIRNLARLVKGGPYIGPKGGLWADPQHTIAWRDDHEDETSHLFHSAPAHAMSRIKREGLTPRKGAGLYQHGGYAEHSQGKVFLSNNLAAAKQWHGKVEDQLFDQHDDAKKHVAVMLRVKPRETQRDEVGDKDVSGSRFVRENVPASDIEFFHEGTKRWKPVKDYVHGTHGAPEDHFEAHAARDEAADAAEKKAKRDASAAKREAEKQASRDRLAKIHEESAKRAAAEASVHFRDTDEGKAIFTRYKDRSPEEREAKAKRIIEAPRPFPGAPSMLSLGQRGEVWREALGVDEKGKLIESRHEHDKLHGMVVRPNGWNATSEEAHEHLSTLAKKDSAWRGMTHAEYENTVGRGEGVRSTGAYSHASEGTQFSEDPRDAESYANYGKDDPRKSGKPTYLVEVDRSKLTKKPDGYYETKAGEGLAHEHVRGVWKFEANDKGEVVASRVSKAAPKISVDIHDSHHGQDDGTVRTDGGKLDFSIYQGRAHIRMVESSRKRAGVGRALVNRLAEEVGGYDKIDWGMMTPDGVALRDALDREHGFDRTEIPIDAKKVVNEHEGKLLSHEDGRHENTQRVYVEFDSPERAQKFVAKVREMNKHNEDATEPDVQEMDGKAWVEAEIPTAIPKRLTKSQRFVIPLVGKARKLHKRRVFGGLSISVETRKGAKRHWHDPHSGESGSTTMLHDYGYIRGSMGSDGDHVDVYVGPHEDATHAYVIDQMRKPDFKKFDEQKVMLGFKSAASAKKAYLAHYNDARFFGCMNAIPFAEFATKVLATKDAAMKVITKKSIPLGGLTLLLKSAMPKSGGWQPIPGGKHGGWRRWRGGKWEYDYGTRESGEHKPTHDHTKWKSKEQFSEEDYREGRFDYDPLHWHPREHAGGEHRAWVTGGVDPHSLAPVKTGGRIDKLYQIENPEEDRGFALLRDLATGEAVIMQHNRIYAVEHDPLKYKTLAKPEKERWDPTTGRTVRAATGKGPSFEGSQADKEKQPGLYAIENGVYPVKAVSRLEPCTEQNEKPVVTLAVTDHGKTLLVSEFKGLIESRVKKYQRAYGVKDVYERNDRGARATNVTQRELAQAGVEGLLVAIEKYQVNKPFAAHVTHYVQNYIRLACARERAGGIELPDTHARNLSKYLAARAEASHALDKENPTPEEVLPYFKLLKRHVHPNLDAAEGSTPVPMESYRLTAHEEKDAKAREVIERERRRLMESMRASKKAGHAVSESDKEKVAKLDEALTKLDDKKMRDTETRPGRRELAELYDSFLTGASSPSDIFDLEEGFAFPGVEVGAGLDPAERVLVRRSTQRVLDEMKDFQITSEGRKKITYSADVGEMIAQRLGLRGDGEERTTAEIARDVPIHANGKPLALRQAQEIAETMIERGLAHVRSKLADHDDVTNASLIFGRAAEKLTPQPRAVPGPTWTEIVSTRAQNVTPTQIAEWRSTERRRLSGIAERIRARAEYEHDAASREKQHALARDTDAAASRVAQIDESEIRMKIASAVSPETAEMRALATRSVAIEGEYRGYERTTTLMPITDIRTGESRMARVRSLRDLRDPEELPTGELGLRKARSRVTTGMVREALHYPRTMLLLTSPKGFASAPTKARAALERLTLGDFG